MPKYLHGLNGFKIKKSGKKIGFVNQEKLAKWKHLLIRIDDHDGIERYEIIGDDEFIIHLVRKLQDQLKIITDYILLGASQDETYFFRIGKAYNFPSGYQIGTRQIYPYQ